MVLSDENEELLHKKLLDLCNKLNLDPKTVNTAWDNFRSINKNYVLEGDALHWLGCAVFVASYSEETPTLQTTVVKGNCISLTSLLRHSNLSFVQFFCNITKWAEMAHLSEDFQRKITHLKDTFGVAHNTFKEYYPIFSKIFVSPSHDLDQPRPRNRKQRPVPCNSSKVFEFIWNLFITLKAEDPQYSLELIKSYHLLYTCIDLAFKNAFLADRIDLLNPQFELLPKDWSSMSYVANRETPCLISYLCKVPSMLTDAMHMKMYVMKNLMSNLIRKKILCIDPVNFTGMFDNEIFEQNFKSITNSYETHILNKIDIDERIFLAEYRRQLIEHHFSTPNIRIESTEHSGLDTPRNNSEMVTPRGCDTPLTGRKFLGPREADISPLSTDRSTPKITRLHNILNGRSSAPSEALFQLFQGCPNDPLNRIRDIVKDYGEKFITGYIDSNRSNEDEARTILELGIALFYKFVENILQNEKQIRNDISAISEKDLFYQCTFACCLEIVIFSYSSTNKFPWILSTLDIQPFHFVKVIELIVRSRDQLSREIIKHLNKVEETILENLAWKSNSQLWDAIEASGHRIPKFEDTALPGHILYSVQNSKKVQNPEITSTSMQSPGPSATDRFQSPISQVTRQLFPSIQAGQSVLQRHTHIMITDKDGNKKLIPIVESAIQQNQPDQNETPQNAEETETLSPAQQSNQNSAQPSAQVSTSAMPRKTGSLSIIFRKVYNLAGVRMEHLCSKLNLVDTELKQKIWTVFEESIRNSDLIKDRHLDQLLMCAIYVICRILNIQLKFQDIMKFYREQPQCTSSVYRDVLLSRETVGTDGAIIKEERSDLIHFYNSVYVDVMQKTAVRFRNIQERSSLLLSPLPAIKRDLVSTSVQVLGNVYVKPLESSSINAATSFNYFFSRSPSKDLKDINKHVNNSCTTRKRLLVESDLEIPNTKRISNRKLQSLVEERRIQNSE